MEYRKFDKIEKPLSLFGIGCMRLPTQKTAEGEKIDEKAAIDMVRYGIDHGVNYIDTAFGYHQGQSEPFVAKALKDGYREKVYLATKMPVWMVKEPKDFEDLLSKQLSRLETDYIDFYLLHGLDKSRWDSLKEMGILEFMQEARAQGRIRYIAFSFHDSYEAFIEIIDAFDWDMCQIQLNFLDNEHQAGVKGLKYAGAKNIPVVIMEPLKGGHLVKSIPDAVAKIWAESPVKRTPAEWGFAWVSQFPEVAVILSGVSNMEQLQDTCRILSECKPNGMTKEENELVGKARETYKALTKVGCTACEYCLPCPSNVQIPNIFTLYNNAVKFNAKTQFANNYKNNLLSKDSGAPSCVECGRCEGLCPQAIPIIEKLKEAHAFLLS